jgi:hypothetical protein
MKFKVKIFIKNHEIVIEFFNIWLILHELWVYISISSFKKFFPINVSHSNYVRGSETLDCGYVKQSIKYSPS